MSPDYNDRKVMDLVLKHSISKFFREAGRKGGIKTAKRGKEYFKEIQKKAVESRKRNKIQRMLDNA